MEDVNLLADLGMNMIRLDVSWAGAEPERGTYNQTYFDIVHRIVDMCKSRGIYVLLEWHQDLFSERYCGNGAPLWASRPLRFPERFRYPFQWSKIRKEAYPNGPLTDKSCEGLNFANGYFNYELSQAFEDFYTNYDGISDSFVNFWRKIASEFKNESSVVGYEFINGIFKISHIEPWVGQFYKHIKLAIPPKADRMRLQPLYEKLHDAVREIDTEKLIFYESLPVTLNKVGFTSLPGSMDNKALLSWHFYWNPIGKDAFITSRIQESKRLHVVPFASEIDISWDGSLRKNLEIDEGGINVNDSLSTMKRLDSELISWLGWEYKTYIKKTGYGEGIFDSINQIQRPIMKSLYSRPYAQAVSGTISEMNYNDDTGTFSLTWTVPPFSSSAPTIISTGRAWHYPNGLYVSITPDTIRYEEKGSLLYVSTLHRSYPQTFRLVVGNN